jgi:hypothetical protein
MVSESSPVRTLEPGTDVLGSCGHKIGQVVEVHPDFVVVEQGFFLCHDLYVPTSAIDHIDTKGVHLSHTKHAVKEAHWSAEPVTQ